MAMILLLDDDPDYLRTLEFRLQRSGHEVETATDGVEGLVKASQAKYRLVVTDLDMPGINGMNLLRVFKRTVPEMEVVVLSEMVDVPQAVEAMRIGAYDVLLKGVDEEAVEVIAGRIDGTRASASAPTKEGEYGEESRWRSRLADRIRHGELTGREIEIVEKLLERKSDYEIGDELRISHHTVKKHLQNIFRKMEVSSRLELALQLAVVD